VLYAAQKLLIPVALAMFFAFLLTPAVMVLQRRGLNRVTSVLAVTLLAVAVFIGFTWLVASQVISFAAELPDYSVNIKNKIEAIHSVGQDKTWQRLEKMVQELSKSARVMNDVPPNANPASEPEPAQQPAAIIVEQSEPLWQRSLLSVFGSVGEFLGQVGLVVVLVIFFLLAREDLRNRFIRLVGHGRLTLTTKAVDDASQRLSRFLVMQLTINVSFGVCLGIGLTLLGVRYALLWGVLAAVLRYVPYIGSPIAALFPLLASIAQFAGWLEPGLIAVLFIVLELLTANVFEPLLFGHSIGASAVALLIAAAFWAFLWGPIGLVLSGPLTVCLVVLGKYVPHLDFLWVLLSDEPALEEDFSYYQRLSAHDEDEAEAIVLDYVKNHPVDEVYDELLAPALIYAGRDYRQQGLDGDDLHFIHETTRGILTNVEAARQELDAKLKADRSKDDHRLDDKVQILAVASRDESETNKRKDEK